MPLNQLILAGIVVNGRLQHVAVVIPVNGDGFHELPPVLHIFVKNGELIPIVRGLYEDNPNVEPSYLAPWIYSPSYLSFDYALYIYDLIPETAYVYTSATFRKRKKKTYNTAFGLYTYQDIPKNVYPYGVLGKTADSTYSYQIAVCEKALCDKLYTINPVKNMKEFKYLLIEDLRIDEENFWSLNMEDILFLAPLYNSTHLNYLSWFVRGGRK